MFTRSEPAESPYSAFLVEEMILRDHLAVDRTSLANERTLLSYARTALAFAISGASVVHFLGGAVSDVVGVVLVAVGVFTGILGVLRYRVYRRRIDVVSARTPFGSVLAED